MLIWRREESERREEKEERREEKSGRHDDFGPRGKRTIAGKNELGPVGVSSQPTFTVMVLGGIVYH